MASEMVKTRILIISDTHCASLDGAPGSAFKRPLPSADQLIHCGDLTYTGKSDEYHKSLDMLKEIDAPVKLVIAGNHDRTLDRDYLLGHLKQYGPVPARAEELWSDMRSLWTAENGRARQDGLTFLDEGIYTINLPNGASVKVYASPYTPEFYDWGFPYKRFEDRYNPSGASLSDAKNIASNPIPSFSESESAVDIMVTHGPPYGRLDATNNGDLAGCEHLLRAVMRCRPLLHCFGHIHEGHGAERVRWAEKADRVAAESISTTSWKDGGWKQGVKDVKPETQGWGFDDEAEGNAAVVAASQDSGKPLERGEETVSKLDPYLTALCADCNRRAAPSERFNHEREIST